jgi:hypothetical protein
MKLEFCETGNDCKAGSDAGWKSLDDQVIATCIALKRSRDAQACATTTYWRYSGENRRRGFTFPFVC